MVFKRGGNAANKIKYSFVQPKVESGEDTHVTTRIYTHHKNSRKSNNINEGVSYG